MPTHAYDVGVTCPQLENTVVHVARAARAGFELVNEGPATIRVALGLPATATKGIPVKPGGTYKIMADGWVNDGGLTGGVWTFLATVSIEVFPLDDKSASGGPKIPGAAAIGDNTVMLHELVV